MLVLDKISSLLPPPSFLRLPSAGVDISDTSLKYIEFIKDSHQRGQLKINSWGDLDIPDEVLSRGSVADVKKLSEILKEVGKKTGLSFVRVSLPEERAYLFETEISRQTKPKEIRSQLEFRLEENVPLSPRDAYFDYHIFDNAFDKSKLTVSVTVYARETIDAYYEACQLAKLTPLSFEVEAQAIARATLSPKDLGTHMIVDFGKTRTGVGIVHRGILMYTSTIDIGGKQLSGALRKQLGDKDESELTDIKNNQGLIQTAGNQEVYEALMSTVSAIKDELVLRVQYWQNRDMADQERFIQSIILCGGSANLKGLPSYLSDALGIKTYRANVWANAFSLEKNIPPISLRHSYGYATAIGLGLTPFIYHD